MSTSIERRLAVLEARSGRHCPAREMSDEALLALLAPLFDGRLPTDAELSVLAEPPTREDR